MVVRVGAVEVAVDVSSKPTTDRSLGTSIPRAVAAPLSSEDPVDQMGRLARRLVVGDREGWHGVPGEARVLDGLADARQAVGHDRVADRTGIGRVQRAARSTG